MCKYKVGDKVVVKKNIGVGDRFGMEGESNQECLVQFSMQQKAGKVVTISDVRNCGGYHRYSIAEDHWNWVDGMFEGLVEDKKMFTKKDLKTGMFGVMSNGDKFIIVNDRIIYQNDGFDDVTRLTEDLCLSFYKITKVYEGVLSFRNLESHLNGHGTNSVKLVYDRERDTKKPLYNGKVVCIEVGVNDFLYTVGKIYQFKDGNFTTDNGDQIKRLRKPVESFDDFNNWSSSKWIEVKE